MADMTKTGPAFIASVITGAPAEARGAVLEAINGMEPETRESGIRAAVAEAKQPAPPDEAEEKRVAAEITERRNKVAHIIHGTPPGWGDEPESWRALMPSRQEWRTVVAEGVSGDGGFLVPSQVAKQLRDRVRAASVFLKAGPTIVTMDSATMSLPTLASSNAGNKTAEKTAIAEATLAFAGPLLTAVKYAGLVNASNEVLADSAVDLRNRIGQIIASDIASQIDTDLFGTTAAAGSIAGLLSAGNCTNTTLAVGNPVPRWDHVLDGIARLEAANLLTEKVVIFADPTAAAALRKERATASGDYLAGGVDDALVKQGFGAPLMVSAKMPAGKVALAAMDYVTVGLRQDITLAVSESYKFNEDVVSFRGTTRVAGVEVQDKNAVQLITGTP